MIPEFTMARSRRDDHDNEPTLEAWWSEPENVRDEHLRATRARGVAAAGADRVAGDPRPPADTSSTLVEEALEQVMTPIPAAAGTGPSRGDLLREDRPDRERETSGRGDR